MEHKLLWKGEGTAQILIFFLLLLQNITMSQLIVTGLSDTPAHLLRKSDPAWHYGLSKNSVNILPNTCTQRARQTLWKNDKQDGGAYYVGYLSLQAINIIIGDLNYQWYCLHIFFTEYTHYTDFMGVTFITPFHHELFDSKFQPYLTVMIMIFIDAIFKYKRTFYQSEEFLQKLYKITSIWYTENEEYPKKTIYSTIRCLF